MAAHIWKVNKRKSQIGEKLEHIFVVQKGKLNMFRRTVVSNPTLPTIF